MRGHRERSGSLFSYVSIEERIPASHPLRRIRKLADQALDRLNPTFCELYASEGRPSVPTEQLLLASLLQAFYGIRQVIVAIGVSNQASDAVHLLPMLERTLANTNTGQMPDALIADAGYCSTANLEACEDRGLNAYISTSRQQHGQRSRPSRGRPPADLDARGRMDRKLRSKAGQTVYALRKTIVEPVFGRIKGARGLDRFRLRGLEKVNGEWA